MELNDLERQAIKSWTSPDGHQYRYIKGILRGDYDGILKSIYEPQAKALVELFKKYPDNTNNQILYRGDILEDKFNKLSKKDIYEQYLLNNPIGKTIILEDTILSFTFSKDIAISSYTNSDKNKTNNRPTILYVLKNRKSVFLDISKFSELPHEQEVLCNQGIKFKVVNIEKKDNYHLLYFLEELQI